MEADKKGLAALLVARAKPADGEAEAPEGAEAEAEEGGMEVAASDMMAAMKSGDAKAFSEALSYWFDCRT